MRWSFDNQTPVFLQIAKQLQVDIICGTYPADSQIPSVRQLAFDASVNPNTVQHALSELEKQGLICTRGTIGRFVTSDTKVLEEARQNMYQEVVKDFMSKARQMGISKQDLIHYIEEVQDE